MNLEFKEFHNVRLKRKEKTDFTGFEGDDLLIKRE